MGAAVVLFAQSFVYGAAAGASAIALAGAALGAIAQIALINYGLGFLSKKLAGKTDRPPLNVTYSGPTVPRRCLYGRRRCYGSYVYTTLSAASGSTRNDYLWLVVSLIDHQCAAIGTIWIDGEKVEPSQINGAGLVTSGKFAGNLSIWKYLGTSQQAANAELVAACAANAVLSGNPAEWTSQHRLRGVTHLVLRCKRDDASWSQGPPQTVSALVDGALCYDARLDSTKGGSGPQREGDPSTWAFTRNPFWQIRHYLTGGSVVNDVSVPLRMYGLRDPDSRMTDTDLIAAANVCDEALTGGVAPPGSDNTRYRSDFEFEVTRTRREIIEALLEACGGAAYPDKGRWRFFAGAYETPVHTLTQDDLYGELKIRDTSGHEERFNAVSAKLDQCDDMDYVEHTTIFQTNATFEEEDGGGQPERIPMTLELEAVTNQYQGQRLAYLKQLKGRLWRRLEWPGSRALMKIRRGATVLVSHSRYGWTNHVYICIERQLVFEADKVLCVLTLEREDPAAYTDLLTAAYSTGINPTPVFMIDGPATPFSFVATPLIGGIQFSWAITPGERPFQTIYELWRHSAATPFASAVKIWEGSGFNVTIPRNDLGTHYYWIRARTAGLQYSGTNPAAAGLPGRAATKWESGNALNLSAWRIGAISGGIPGEVGNFDVIQSVTGENSIVLAGTGSAPAGPRNRSIPLWISQSIDASGITPDGGWSNGGDCYGIDHLKTYRSVVVFQYTGTASGNFYHAPNWPSVSYLGGGAAGGEVYFVAFPLADLVPGRWYVSVGFIHGSGYGSTPSGQGGVYDMTTGRIVKTGTDWKSTPGALQQQHTAFMRNCANSALRLYMCEPRFEEVNGNEASMLELIGIATTGGVTPGATETLLVFTDDNIDIGAAGSPGSVGVQLATFDVSDYSHPDNETVITVQGMIDIQSPAGTFSVWLDITGTSFAYPSPTDENTVIETSSTGAVYAQQSFSMSRHLSGINSLVNVTAVAWSTTAPSVAKIYGLKIFVEIKKRANA